MNPNLLIKKSLSVSCHVKPCGVLLSCETENFFQISGLTDRSKTKTIHKCVNSNKHLTSGVVAPDNICLLKQNLLPTVTCLNLAHT